MRGNFLFTGQLFTVGLEQPVYNDNDNYKK